MVILHLLVVLWYIITLQIVLLSHSSKPLHVSYDNMISQRSTLSVVNDYYFASFVCLMQSLPFQWNILENLIASFQHLHKTNPYTDCNTNLSHIHIHYMVDDGIAWYLYQTCEFSLGILYSFSIVFLLQVCCKCLFDKNMNWK